MSGSGASVSNPTAGEPRRTPLRGDTLGGVGVRIQVRGPDGLLFEGPARFASGEGEWSWCAEFLVPNTQVAQFQMRRGEEVRVCVNDGPGHRAWIGGFGFEDDSSASGIGGHGRISLLGRDEVPAS